MCNWWTTQWLVTCFRDSITNETLSLVDHVNDGLYNGMLPVSRRVLSGRRSVYWLTMSLMDHTMARYMFQGQYYQGDIVSLVDHTVAFYLFQGQCYQTDIASLVDQITDGPHSGMLPVSGTVLPWRQSVTGGPYNGMLPVSGAVLPDRHSVTGGPNH